MEASRSSTSPGMSCPAAVEVGSPPRVLTDGGMLSSFPINIFDRTHGTPRWPTFGVKLSARTVDRWTDNWASVDTPIRLGKALVPP